MLTQKQLAEMLLTVNVQDVAKLAGVSEKTIYRLRHMQHSPSLSTAEKIIAAVEALRPKRRRKVGT